MNDEGMFLYLLPYRFALNNRRDNFKYCQLVDNGDVITATKTESFTLKLKTRK